MIAIYIDETREEWVNIQNIKDVLKKEKKEEVFNKKVEKRTKYWREIESELIKLIEERNHFVVSYTFYPRDYAIMISTLEVKLESVREYISKNPLKQDKEIKNLIIEESYKVTDYLDVKNRVEKILPDLQKFFSTLETEEEKLDYYVKKQDLYLSLQNGKIDKATRLLNYFENKLSEM